MLLLGCLAMAYLPCGPSGMRCAGGWLDSRLRTPEPALTLAPSDRTADADVLFRRAVESAAASDVQLAAELLDAVCALDQQQLLSHHYAAADASREPPHRTAVNVTCRQPAGGVDGYYKYNDELLSLPTREGRLCAGGACGCSCSRVFLRAFASAAECAQLTRLADERLEPPTAPEGLKQDVHLSDVLGEGVEGGLLVLRLVERLRRAVSIEYGLPLRTLTPRFLFLNRISAPAESDLETLDVGQLHADESSNGAYHYSCVLYLNEASDDTFDGGDLCFVAGDDEWASAGGRTPRVRLLAPRVGQAALFSSGWENLHHVAPVIAGTRYVLPVFFTTQPPFEAVQQQRSAEERAAALGELAFGSKRPAAEREEQLLALWATLFSGS